MVSGVWIRIFGWRDELDADAHCLRRGDRLAYGLERRFKPRRIEIIDGAGGRQIWSADAKVAVLDETLLPGAVVSMLGRCHRRTPQLVFGWRQEARRALEAERIPLAVGFLPAIVAEPTPEPLAPPYAAVPPCATARFGHHCRDRIGDLRRRGPRRTKRERAQIAAAIRSLKGAA